MPYKDCLMPTKMFESTINAEILRICKATTKYIKFVESVRILVQRMKCQGANIQGIAINFHKVFHRHKIFFSKFNCNYNTVVNDLFFS